MNIYTFVISFLILCSSQTFAQNHKVSWRFNIGVAISEPDLRGKSIIPNLMLGQPFKDIILAADASILDSYSCSFEGSYYLKRWLELFGQIGHTTFYDDFPMVINNDHFAKHKGNIHRNLKLVSKYFNYCLSPGIGLNLRVVDIRDRKLLLGTNLSCNFTYYKLITKAYERGRSGPGANNKFFFDSHSLEAFASSGFGYKKMTFFVDYRYFVMEYLVEATYNDGIAIKYENLTKFRLRLTHDLKWKKSNNNN